MTGTCLLIHQLLKKYKYPPEGKECTAVMVLEQAMMVAVGWGN